MIELLNHVGRLWWVWTVSMFWQVSLLILLIGCIDLLIRRWAWPQLRYALWSLILVKLLLPPTWSLPSAIVPELKPVVGRVVRWLDTEGPAAATNPAAMSDWGLVPLVHDDVLQRVGAPSRFDPQFKESVVATGRVAEAEDSARSVSAGTYEETPDGITTNALESAAAGVAPGSDPGPALAWQFYAMMIWLSGTLTLGIWLLLRLQSVAGRHAYRAAAASLPQSFYNHLAGCSKRLGLRRIPRVAVTKRLTSPAVFGVFRPVLLMPKGYLSKLSRRDTEHMLLHELAHIKRGDLVMHSLYMLLQVVYWYNPLLWLVRQQVHHLRELSCDGTVAELLRERTLAYRQTLLETARRLLATSAEPGLGLLGLFEDSNRLLVRLNWLTKPTWRYKTMKRVTVATIALLMFACVLPMAQAQESASNESSPTVVREQDPPSQDQQSQEIAALQAKLKQLMIQQQELQKQIQALSEQRNRPRVERRETVVRRAAPTPRPVQKAPGDEAASAPGANENVNRIPPEAREQVKRAEAQVKRAQDEVKRAMKEAARARKEAERAQAEAHVHAQNQQDWAKSMQAYGQQMKKWDQGEPMQKWRAEMEKWGQEMGRWGEELGRRQAAAATGSAEGAEAGEMPPMPPMPPMPAMPPTPPVPQAPMAVPEIHIPSAPLPPLPPVPPGAVESHDGREEAVSHLERTVEVPADALLLVVNQVGSINIRGTDEPDCKVVATVKAKADTMEKARQIIDQVQLVVAPSNGTVLISTTQPEARDKQKGPGFQVALEVTVPRNVRLKVTQSVGDIRLADLTGSVEATVKVGSIRTSNVSGRVALSTDVGSIEFIAPQDFSAKVQAKANIGSIQSDFPLQVPKPRGIQMGSSASGTIGGGKGELSVKTNVGSIRIRSQSAESKRTQQNQLEPEPQPSEVF